MPDFPSIHYLTAGGTGAACGAVPDGSKGQLASSSEAAVTCFACRKSAVFQAAQTTDVLKGVGEPTPLKEIIATDGQLQTLFLDSLAEIVKRGLNRGTNDAEHEALTEVADALRLTWDEETEKWA